MLTVTSFPSFLIGPKKIHILSTVRHVYLACMIEDCKCTPRMRCPRCLRISVIRDPKVFDIRDQHAFTFEGT